MVAARRSYIDWLLRTIDPGIEGTFGFTDIQGKLSLTPSPRHAIQATVIGGRALLRENDSRPGVNSLDRARHTVAIGNLRWQFTLVHAWYSRIRPTSSRGATGTPCPTDGRDKKGWIATSRGAAPRSSS